MMITKLTIKSYLQLISLKKNYSVQALFTLFLSIKRRHLISIEK